MADEGVGPDGFGGYRAFLSYSHKDARWGAKLHRRLESYKLPKRLAGSETARGVVPDRLSPVFRDREELSAAESLSDTIKAALAASDALIVLCSPAAKASPWVAKEIALFRALHPDRPVLAALVEGEPGEAFPEGLTFGGAEPIAADFRKGQGGERLALLKLAAGMTGVPLDALVQRDAQRQIRRVTAVTSLALAAVLVMALLTTFAFRAQREAERQRAEAEGLVEYMLTDLRDRLKGVGRLDVMTAVNERAMKYYGGQGDLSRLPVDSLARRARILHAMGEDDDKRGNQRLAREKFAEAHRTTAAILTKRPNDENAIFAHAQSEYWVGYAALNANHDEEALMHFEGYQRLAARLVEKAPSNAAWQREAAYADGNLCSVYLEAPPKPDLAVPACEAALARMTNAAALDPTDEEAILSIPNRLGWLADAYVAKGDLITALGHRRAQKAITDKHLREKPADARWQERALLSRLSLGQLLAKLSRTDEAKELIVEARDMAKRRALANPDDSEMRRFLNQIELANNQMKGK